jgi:2-oxo-4-hydroxy-4-carboxy-5-ureidoimidazoline decarboxylase
MMNIAEVNEMPQDVYISFFGDVAEKSPWLAMRTLRYAPFASREALVTAYVTVLKSANQSEKLALIKAHPDLATRVKLSDTSAQEQKGAGLDTLNEEELARFNELNATYTSQFGFPFIFAVKGATKHQILESFERRLSSSQHDEFALAIDMICRIMRFRIEDRVAFS